MGHATFANWMEQDAVSFEELQENYSSLLGLVKLLLGVVPNCDRYMEIWPVSFRTYNLMVPNFINLPQMLIGMGAPKDLIGLALYGSSLASECPYCTAHCCSFAQRRGAAPEAMMGGASPVQAAVLEASTALGAMPHNLTADHLAALSRHLKPQDVEWVGMGIAMMGFLNKFMDALGVPLEEASVADSHAILAKAGMTPGKHFTSALPASVRPQTDNWQLYSKIVTLAPGALRFDARWLRGVPKAQDAASGYLKQKIGIDVPLLDRMQLARPRRALAGMLRENLDPAQSRLGLRSKALLALVFAEFSRNAARRADAMALLAQHGGPPDASVQSALQEMARGPVAQTAATFDAGLAQLKLAGLSEHDASLLMIGHALSPSPAAVSPTVLERAMRDLSRAQMVEVVTWLSVQQLMHRLDVFFDVAGRP